MFRIRGYDYGLESGQIYKVIMSCPTVDCYGGEKGIKVLGWIEALLKEQDIYYEVECLFKGCEHSPYCIRG